MQAGVFVVAGTLLLCCLLEQLVVCVCAEREEEHMEEPRSVGSCEAGRREKRAKNRHTRRYQGKGVRGRAGGGSKGLLCLLSSASPTPLSQSKAIKS